MMMKFQRFLFVGVLSCGAAHGAEQVDVVFTPAAGTHEVKMFHACYDNEDVQKRQRVNLVMQGLASTDVELVARVPESGKPSTEMILFRVKGKDASIKTLFRSHDGPHCQQGVHSVQFTDRVVHAAGQLGVRR